MRYRTRERLLEHKVARRSTIQVRVRVDALLKLVDLQEHLPYNDRGYDLGDALEAIVNYADRRCRQEDPQVDKGTSGRGPEVNKLEESRRLSYCVHRYSNGHLCGRGQLEHTGMPGAPNGNATADGHTYKPAV